MLGYTIDSPLFLTTLILYFLVSCITTFDTRLIQAKRVNRPYPFDLPEWTGIFSIIYFILLIALFVMHWKLALAAKVVQFILKFLPVLEIIGSFMMTPFLRKVTKE